MGVPILAKWWQRTSDASCKQDTAMLCILGGSPLIGKFWQMPLTSLMNGRFLIRSSVLFWYLRISCKAFVLGLNRLFFLPTPVAGPDTRAGLVASPLMGAFPPVLRAVCLIRGMGCEAMRGVTVRLYTMFLLYLPFLFKIYFRADIYETNKNSTSCGTLIVGRRGLPCPIQF